MEYRTGEGRCWQNVSKSGIFVGFGYHFASQLHPVQVISAGLASGIGVKRAKESRAQKDEIVQKEWQGISCQRGDYSVHLTSISLSLFLGNKNREKKNFYSKFLKPTVNQLQTSLKIENKPE